MSKKRKRTNRTKVYILIAIGLSLLIFLTGLKNDTRPRTHAQTVANPITVIAASDFHEGAISTSANVAQSLNPDYIIAAGDISSDGTLSSYQSTFTPSWGKMMNKIYPAPGNHDILYGTTSGGDYLSYFAARYPGKTKNQLWYSVNWGAWHIISLNSINVTTEEINWLKQDLAANANKPILAFWHYPRWSVDAKYGNMSNSSQFWDALYAAHADIVVDGHVHDYQRWAKMNPSGKADANGIREFTDMTASDHLRTGSGSDALVEKVLDKPTGFIKFTLNPDSYSWQYIGIDGKVYDQGTSPVNNKGTSTISPSTSLPTTVVPSYYCLGSCPQNTLTPTLKLTIAPTDANAPTPTGLPSIAISLTPSSSPTQGIQETVTPTISPCESGAVSVQSEKGRHGKKTGLINKFLNQLIQLIMLLLQLLGLGGGTGNNPFVPTPTDVPTVTGSQPTPTMGQIFPTVDPCATN